MATKYSNGERIEMSTKELQQFQATFAGRQPPNVVIPENPLKAEIETLKQRVTAAEAKLPKNTGAPAK